MGVSGKIIQSKCKISFEKSTAHVAGHGHRAVDWRIWTRLACGKVSFWIHTPEFSQFLSQPQHCFFGGHFPYCMEPKLRYCWWDEADSTVLLIHSEISILLCMHTCRYMHVCSAQCILSITDFSIN